MKEYGLGQEHSVPEEVKKNFARYATVNMKLNEIENFHNGEQSEANGNRYKDLIRSKLSIATELEKGGYLNKY